MLRRNSIPTIGVVSDVAGINYKPMSTMEKPRPATINEAIQNSINEFSDMHSAQAVQTTLLAMYNAANQDLNAFTDIDRDNQMFLIRNLHKYLYKLESVAC